MTAGTRGKLTWPTFKTQESAEATSKDVNGSDRCIKRHCIPENMLSQDSGNITDAVM
jgi:hypothetical protein